MSMVGENKTFTSTKGEVHKFAHIAYFAMFAAICVRERNYINRDSINEKFVRNLISNELGISSADLGNMLKGEFNVIQPVVIQVMLAKIRNKLKLARIDNTITECLEQDCFLKADKRNKFGNKDFQETLRHCFGSNYCDYRAFLAALSQDAYNFWIRAKVGNPQPEQRKYISNTLDFLEAGIGFNEPEQEAIIDYWKRVLEAEPMTVHKVLKDIGEKSGYTDYNFFYSKIIERDSTEKVNIRTLIKKITSVLL